MKAIVRLLACFVLAATAFAPLSLAQGGDPNECDAPGDAPNVIVGDLHQLDRHGEQDGITAFSVGTYSCNIGTCWLDWDSESNNHPTIGQNMFRLKDGRFEQLGQSWLKHGFVALNEELCSTGCVPTDGTHLGVNCADPYSASLNGNQRRLGPKFEVNTVTGVHVQPHGAEGVTGDTIYKRLQVHNVDLDPTLNSGARYFVEGQYVAQDDALAGNSHDNNSYREVEVVELMDGGYDIQFVGDTVRRLPAILAWSASDPYVVDAIADVESDGRFHLAGKATRLGDGWWRYEYAVQNITSHRSAMSFSVPLPPGTIVDNVGFNDVDYHSGEPYDLTDWSNNGGANDEVTWTTATFDTDENANALRWGTLYNFRFDANAGPGTNDVSIGLFRPGTSNRVTASLVTPAPCNADGTCDAEETCLSCAEDCPLSGDDLDGDGVDYCLDCNDYDGESWSRPTEVRILWVRNRPELRAALLLWAPPADIGARSVVYEMLRASTPTGFGTGKDCLVDPVTTDTSGLDAEAPGVGNAFYYLVRAKNTCAAGDGALGRTSLGDERLGTACP